MKDNNTQPTHPQGADGELQQPFTDESEDTDLCLSCHLGRWRHDKGLVKCSYFPPKMSDTTSELNSIFATAMTEYFDLMNGEPLNGKPYVDAKKAIQAKAVSAIMHLLREHHKPQPVGDGELRKMLLSVLYEYENFYKIGYDHGRDGEEKNWGLATGLAEKHADVMTNRLQGLIAAQTDAAQRELLERLKTKATDCYTHGHHHIDAIDLRILDTELQHLKSQESGKGKES